MTARGWHEITATYGTDEDIQLDYFVMRAGRPNSDRTVDKVKIIVRSKPNDGTIRSRAS
jgi:hypothetical protein